MAASGGVQSAVNARWHFHTVEYCRRQLSTNRKREVPLHGDRPRFGIRTGDPDAFGATPPVVPKGQGRITDPSLGAGAENAIRVHVGVETIGPQASGPKPQAGRRDSLNSAR